MSDLLKVAFSQFGIQEIPGAQHNEQIVKYATELGITGISDDEVPWCSTFVNWCAKKAGLQYSGKPNARSWLSVGEKTTQPEPGDVAVFWRGNPQSWEGHVAIFLGYSPDATRIFVIGGNQGNKVSVASYRADTLLAFQRLSEKTQIIAPAPVLKKGDKGPKVIQLQNALNTIGINAGKADGDFGPGTEKALKELQKMQANLPVDGVYNQKTRDLLESKLQQ